MDNLRKLALITIVFGFAQYISAQVTVTDRLTARQNITLRGVKVDSIATDSALTHVSHNELATSQAIKEYVFNNSWLRGGNSQSSPLIGGTVSDYDLILRRNNQDVQYWKNSNVIVDGRNCFSRLSSSGVYNYVGSAENSFTGNTTGNNNMLGAGYNTFSDNTTGSGNIIGASVGSNQYATSANGNVYGAGLNIAPSNNGDDNIVGAARYVLTEARDVSNTQIGAAQYSLIGLRSGVYNSIGAGSEAGYAMDTASYNTMMGKEVLYSLQEGDYNTGIGYSVDVRWDYFSGLIPITGNYTISDSAGGIKITGLNIATEISASGLAFGEPIFTNRIQYWNTRNAYIINGTTIWRPDATVADVSALNMILARPKRVSNTHSIGANVIIDKSNQVNLGGTGTSEVRFRAEGVSGFRFNTSTFPTGSDNGKTWVYNSSTGQFDIGTPTTTTSGAAGGDLSGTYPNPTVSRIAGQNVLASTPTAGQSFVYEAGTGWAPRTMWQRNTSNGKIWSASYVGINGESNPVSALSNTSTTFSDNWANIANEGWTIRTNSLNYAVGVLNNNPGGSGLLVQAGDGTGQSRVISASDTLHNQRFMVLEDGRTVLNRTSATIGVRGLQAAGIVRFDTLANAGLLWADAAGDLKPVSIGTGITFSSGTITSTGGADGSATNEGILGVGAGGANTSALKSNTSGANSVLFYAGTGLSITENTSSNGGEIIYTNTGDLSVTNEGILSVGAGTGTSATITSTTSGANAVNILSGTGISITEATSVNGGDITVTNTGDTNAADDVTTSTSFGGDVSGFYNAIEIGTGVIGTNEIATNGVGSAEIATDAVGSPEIAADAVGTSEIVDAAVTMAKINQASATTGQVIKWNGSAWAPANDSIGGGGGTTIYSGNGTIGASTTRTVTVPTTSTLRFEESSSKGVEIKTGANLKLAVKDGTIEGVLSKESLVLSTGSPGFEIGTTFEFNGSASRITTYDNDAASAFYLNFPVPGPGSGGSQTWPVTNSGGFLRNSGTGDLTWSDLQQTVKFETAGTGTWTIPTGAKTIEVLLQGGGGGGGSGRRGAAGSVRSGGAGGGAGGTTIMTLNLSDLSNPTTLYYEVGAGGIGGASRTSNDTNGAAGNNGSETYLALTSSSDKICRAVGGISGNGGTNTTATGGSGGIGAIYTGGAGAGSSSTGAAGSSGVSNGVTHCVGGGSGGGIVTGNTASNGGTGNSPYGSLYTGSSGGVVGATLNGGNAVSHGRATFSAIAGGGGASSITGNAGSGGNGIHGSGGGGGGASVNDTGNSGAGGNGGDGRIWIYVKF